MNSPTFFKICDTLFLTCVTLQLRIEKKERGSKIWLIKIDLRSPERIDDFLLRLSKKLIT